MSEEKIIDMCEVKERVMELKCVKKPVEVRAVQWTGDNFEEIEKFCGKICIKEEMVNVAYMSEILKEGYVESTLMIQTLEGIHESRIGDYIIKGVRGECYPCKKNIFEETYNYSPVEE